MEQLEFKVNSKCDRCDEFKPRAFSYFTERMWYCDECEAKVELAKSMVIPRKACQLNDDAPFKPYPTTKTHTADGIGCQVSIDGVILRDYITDCENYAERQLFFNALEEWRTK